MNTMLEQHRIHNYSAANHQIGEPREGEREENADIEMLIPPLTVELTRDDYNTI